MSDTTNDNDVVESGAGCDATVYLKDDRWGGFRDRCELEDGHPGPHVVAYSACEPVAWLSWMGSFDATGPIK